MNLTIIGGGGVRTPLLVNGLLNRLRELPVKQLVLYDSDPEKLRIIGTLAIHLAQKRQTTLQIECTTDIRRAVAGADFIYTAIRVGQESGRVMDERIPLRYGVLGQETTGPGGFAMALRTIPAMLEYARIIEAEAPDAWVINFTNPAGLITEALLKHTNLRVIGICDAPSSLQAGIARFLNLPADHLRINYFGLNHLGWINSIQANGTDLLPELLAQYDSFTKTFPHMACFSQELIQQLQLLPNEYLYYYYYREEAVSHILNSTHTRGEQIVQLNHDLMNQLHDCLAQGDLEQATAVYHATMQQRNSTYMSNETGKSHEEIPLEADGYEGLAMSILSTISGNVPKTLILNVRNNGAIAELRPDDVVEVPCLLDRNGPLPLAVGPLPSRVVGLVQSVKEYELLTVSVAVNGSYEDALLALTVHPLVGSHTLAKKILDDYLDLHHLHLPQFSGRSNRHG